MSLDGNNRGWIMCMLLTVLFSVCALFAVHAETQTDMSIFFGGCGGVYIYAEPGDLWIEIAKQDLNIDNQETHLRAILFAPDRSVLAEAFIDDDGLSKGDGPGPLKNVRLQTTVEHAGIYGVNITVTNDRYGDRMSWAFRTNSDHYLVETSRGHRDARHMEPIVLRDAGKAGDVCFLPRAGAFDIEVLGLSPTAGKPALYDGGDTLITRLSPDGDGNVKYSVSEDRNRGGRPWRLHFPSSCATLHIDGVTRWKSGERAENLSLWTPERTSWFDFHDNRWLLTPYSRTVYTRGCKYGTIPFEVHNNSSTKQRYVFALESDDDTKGVFMLPMKEVLVDPGKSEVIKLEYTLPDIRGEKTVRLRATTSVGKEYSTWSTVTVNPGYPVSDKPLNIPMVLKPYNHENELFGYCPDYPTENQMYFDMDNHPFSVVPDGVFSLQKEKWHKTTSARLSDGSEIPIRTTNTRVAFDGDNNVYCLGRHNRTSVLLCSRDGGKSFDATELPGTGRYDIESFTGHNTHDGPPPLARLTQTAADPNLIWRRINTFDLFLPSMTDDGSIVIGKPIRISDLCIGLSIHSGIPTVIASHGDRVHVVWGEATDPDDNAPGVPAYAATYDRESKTLGKPVLVGYGPPANDIHNTPCITIDSKGYLHVFVGTHGRTFKYARSLEADDAAGGFTEAEDVGRDLSQTYIGIACGEDDTLHLVFRLWLRDTAYFPAGHYATLAYMKKKPGESWSKAQPLVVAPFSEYSIFYHRLTIDRKGALFLSKDYWSTFWFYRTDHRGKRRSLMTSPDGGETWLLASPQLFTGVK